MGLQLLHKLQEHKGKDTLLTESLTHSLTQPLGAPTGFQAR